MTPRDRTMQQDTVSPGMDKRMNKADQNAAQRESDVDDAFLVEVGQRVRRMRALRGMSRKTLAQVSGISERYIAQLESGQGNASILLLRRLAAATGAPLEDFVADPASRVDDWELIRDLLRNATPQMVTDVKALLTGSAAPSRQPAGPKIAVDRVALIGLRGGGKSTLGKLAAERLGWPFVELNREVEQEAGLSMAEILALYGQEGYRRFEQASLRKIIARTGPMVLATGGGIVAEPLTFELLLSSFFTVWVKASPQEHMMRVREQGDLRPMANDKAAMSELVTILNSRAPLYSRARASVDTAGQSVEQSLTRLVELVNSYCVNGCPWQSRNRA